MSPKFFHADNASRVFESGGSLIQFQCYSMFAGATRGVFKADSDRDAAKLMMLARDPTTGVSEIDEQCYVAKKPNGSSGTGQSITTPIEDYSWGHTLRDYPSFTKQTDWESGLFENLMPHKLASDFNCSIATVSSQTSLITRRSVKNTVGPWNSTMMRYNLGKDMSVKDGRPVKVPNHSGVASEQIDDPRVTVHKDKIYISYCIWHRNNYLPRQVLSEFDSSWKWKSSLSPAYGNNGLKDRGQEKNWIWFYSGGCLRFIYRFNPHIVCTVTGNSVTEVHQTTMKDARWYYGEVRGGTPPVKHLGKYYSFFHSSMPWTNRQRRYFMGAYAFDPSPPFEVTNVTPEPLLAGSAHDTRILGGPLVIFPGGALINRGQWTVVFGVNDEACGWIKIPHQQLLEKMVPC